MNQTDLNKGKDGRAALDDEVTTLLGALPRVEAPGDFDFGVRAKIAQGRGRRTGVLPLLKLAAPLALLLVITGFVFYYGNAEPNNLPEVVAGPPQTTAPASSTPEIPVVTQTPQLAQRVDEPLRPQTASARPKEAPVRRVRDNQNSNARGGSVDMPPGGGSTVFSLESANTISPPGFRSLDRNRRGNSNTAPDTAISMDSTLEFLGLTVEFAKGDSKVTAVGENSLAARAGLKPGDIIETIDGNPVKKDTKLKSEGVKSFVVRRAGKRLNLKIGN
jgi:membrane-associated protease RseP (regulator of RpoE activity)